MILLKRSLSIQQWISLFTLTLGVGIVQLNSTSTQSNSHLIPRNHTLGLLSVLSACLSSGFASTYFERVLKSSHVNQPSLWIRNIQLSLFGILVGLPLVWYQVNEGWSVNDGVLEGIWQTRDLVVASEIARESFLRGFTSLTWMVIFLQATGGLLGGESSCRFIAIVMGLIWAGGNSTGHAIRRQYSEMLQYFSQYSLILRSQRPPLRTRDITPSCRGCDFGPVIHLGEFHSRDEIESSQLIL